MDRPSHCGNRERNCRFGLSHGHDDDGYRIYGNIVKSIVREAEDESVVEIGVEDFILPSTLSESNDSSPIIEALTTNLNSPLILVTIFVFFPSVTEDNGETISKPDLVGDEAGYERQGRRWIGGDRRG